MAKGEQVTEILHRSTAVLRRVWWRGRPTDETWLPFRIVARLVLRGLVQVHTCLFEVESVFIHGQSYPPRLSTATWSVSKGPLLGCESLNRDLKGQVRQGKPFWTSRGAVAGRGDFLPAMIAYIFC